MLLTQVVVSACPARGASGAAAGAAVGTLTAATHSGRCPIGTRAAELRVQICRPPGHNGFNQTVAVCCSCCCFCCWCCCCNCYS